MKVFESTNWKKQRSLMEGYFVNQNKTDSEVRNLLDIYANLEIEDVTGLTNKSIAKFLVTDLHNKLIEESEYWHEELNR